MGAGGEGWGILLIHKMWITCFFFNTSISRPGQRQGLLYKQPCDSFSEWPFSPTALRSRHTQTVRDSSSSYKIVIKNFLNPEGHQNPIHGSKVTAAGLYLKYVCISEKYQIVLFSTLHQCEVFFFFLLF